MDENDGFAPSPLCGRGLGRGAALRAGEGRGEGASLYADFNPAVTDRRALAELVKSDPGVAAAQSRFLQTLEGWWQENQPLVEDLAPKNGQKGNVYEPGAVKEDVAFLSSFSLIRSLSLHRFLWIQ